MLHAPTFMDLRWHVFRDFELLAPLQRKPESNQNSVCCLKFCLIHIYTKHVCLTPNLWKIQWYSNLYFFVVSEFTRLMLHTSGCTSACVGTHQAARTACLTAAQTQSCQNGHLTLQGIHRPWRIICWYNRIHNFYGFTYQPSKGIAVSGNGFNSICRSQ